MITCGSSRVMLGLGAFASLRQGIRVHTWVGELDNGVCHAGGEVLIDQAVGIRAFLGPSNFGTILCGTKTLLGSRTAGEILAGAVHGFLAAAFGIPKEGFFPDGSAMQCKVPSWSAM
jgi:hypothetical protein